MSEKPWPSRPVRACWYIASPAFPLIAAGIALHLVAVFVGSAELLAIGRYAAITGAFLLMPLGVAATIAGLRMIAHTPSDYARERTTR